MQYWRFRDFVSLTGRNLMREWLDGLPPADKAAINARIRLCEVIQPLVRPYAGKLTGGDCGGLIELRIRTSNAAYRPLGYYGPQRGEISLLIGASERGGAFVPADACRTAQQRRGLLEARERITCDHDYG